MAKSNKQTGTPNPKNFTKGSGRINRLMPPWGSPLPVRLKGNRGKVYGSSTRQSKPAPEERGMQYPINQPSQWPVEPDFVNHVLAPPLSGVTPATEASHNAAVEHAYTRDGYQSSP